MITIPIEEGKINKSLIAARKAAVAMFTLTLTRLWAFTCGQQAENARFGTVLQTNNNNSNNDINNTLFTGGEIHYYRLPVVYIMAPKTRIDLPQDLLFFNYN